MKKAIFAVFAMLAMAFSVSATAAPLAGVYTADNGLVYDLNHALSFEKVPGAVKVRSSNNTEYTLPDSSGVLYNKLATSTDLAKFYVQVPGTLLHMNVTAALYVMCYNGNQTAFAYAGNTPARFFADGCTIHNAVKAASN